MLVGVYSRNPSFKTGIVETEVVLLWVFVDHKSLTIIPSSDMMFCGRSVKLPTVRVTEEIFSFCKGDPEP